MSDAPPTAIGAPVKVFVSHSSRDFELVEAFVELLLAAMPIRRGEIRCTSVMGCRLSGGADPADALVDDIRSCSVFVGLITDDSAAAPYVLFELGARWGNRGRIFPVLGPGANYDLLPGPVRTLNAFKTADRGHMHQLIREIAAALRERPDTPDAYHTKLEALVEQRGGSGAEARDVRNVRTVAQLLTQKSALKDNAIRVRGTVVKFNADIMGRNWIHLRDSSTGGPDNDITVTTAGKAEIGDVVLAEGVLNVNKDFGAGYAYPAIIEDASITK
jgi:hypothetical protein